MLTGKSSLSIIFMGKVDELALKTLQALVNRLSPRDTTESVHYSKRSRIAQESQSLTLVTNQLMQVQKSSLCVTMKYF